jgi:hypothetical protein
MLAIRRTGRRTACALAASALVFGAAACTAASGVPAVNYPPATTVPLYGVAPTLPVATYTGYAPPLGVVTTTISTASANATLTFTDANTLNWVTFTVTLTNSSNFSFVNVGLLLVLGSCTCNPRNYDTAPHTTVQFFDTTTQGWRTIKATYLDSHGNYKDEDQVAGLNLGAKDTETFQYRMAMLNPENEAGLTSGESSVNIYVLQLPERSRLTVGQGPDATVPLAYQVG